MNTIDQIKLGQDLKQMKDMSPGFKILVDEMEKRMKNGWDEFICLPVDKKTAKASYKFQAEYSVLKDLLEWIEDKIKRSEQMEKLEKLAA